MTLGRGLTITKQHQYKDKRMACPLTQGGSCNGCESCSPETFLPAQDPYFGPGEAGGDQDPHEQPRGHPQ